MTERQELLAEAKELGLSFAANAKTDTIKKAVATAKEDKAQEAALIEAGGTPTMVGPTESQIRAQLEAEFAVRLEEEKRKISANMEVNMMKTAESAATGMLSIGHAKLKARREATKLKRVIVTCKDPAKQNWEGEIFTVSNDVVGDIKKYVPYNLEEGYHVPQMILNMLKDRKCTIFMNKKGRDGKYVQTAKTINAHNIEYLPDLTQDELDELASEQAARGSIGND